jgi:hypothetical protein
MIGIFAIEINLWYKELGKIIDPILNPKDKIDLKLNQKDKNLSPKLKSVLLSHFL